MFPIFRIGSLFFSLCMMVFCLTSSAYAISRRPALDDEDVIKISNAARDSFAKSHIHGCIVVADEDGMPLFVLRQADAVANCLSSALAKAKSAALFQSDTNNAYVSLMKGETHELAVPDLSANPGGLPLFVGKRLVGSVAVSTPDGNADLAAVRAGLAAFEK
ncbi:heme-binding protein [Gluconobacter kanchanaburiensis]|uniref:GlcG protein n=1 Tax=Gluconobacter kanchanaburiensis NBRC 103587 TaxID=1307948 RepID=A0A511BGX7_9PROT|nr:heme-binding protein [Gluconobacter kanchanaburiensis]MBF0862778.1 hypothetical protein [Gluconobacter kanchanaburiensis]GBR68490.1 hypothetical protein AA103587_0832 [Gluconobacter kanchanaburiensis NBRC 103587]GEK97057.1 hypothetical protein GKA01_22540 [Gluconobacter kanchanaburiensis NBRC 103587]